MKTKYKIDRSKHDAAPAMTCRDSRCPVCGETLPVDTMCVWVSDVGVFHTDCVEDDASSDVD